MKNKVLKSFIIICLFLSFSFTIPLNIKAYDESNIDKSLEDNGEVEINKYSDSEISDDEDLYYDDSSKTTGSSNCNTIGCKILVISLSILIFLLISAPVVGIIIFIIFFVIESGKNNKVRDVRYEENTRNSILKVMPEFDIEDFEEKSYKIFCDIQTSFMEFDYNKLKELLTNELYNTYKSELDVLKNNNQKNIITDFELIDNQMIQLDKQDDKYIAKVILEVEFMDYVEDMKTHEIPVGTNSRKTHNTYILKFEGKLKEENINKCLKCGAPITNREMDKCEYCKTKISNNNYTWILREKSILSKEQGK